MNFQNLNKMIEYIEEHLTEKIDYKYLAIIVGVSEYSLQRFFVFLTNVSLAEYIRKRRLSKALEELKNSDIKVIDLAVKYQYESAISFSRAFKNMFGISPSEVKSCNKYKLFPVIKFDNMEFFSELKYEIKYLDKFELYCKKTSAKTHEDFLYKVRKLYEDTKLNKEFEQNEKIGITLIKDEVYTYYLGSKLKLKNLEKFIINEGKYIVFEVGSREQKDIDKVELQIYSKWLEELNYKTSKEIYIEVYKGNNCYIYIPVEDKQNTNK